MMHILLALHSHVDTLKYMPLASTMPVEHVPGSTTEDTQAGFSWLAQLSPYMQGAGNVSGVLRGAKIRTAYDQPTDRPFDPNLKGVGGDWNRHPATQVFPELLCPAVDSTQGRIDGAKDYRSIEGSVQPARTSYHALVATHFTNVKGIGYLYPIKTPETQRTYHGNGGIVFPGRIGTSRLASKGQHLAAVSDGTSNTIAIGESRESKYASWIDGQATWMVAAWPGNPNVPEPRDHNWLRWPDNVKDRNITSLKASSDPNPKVYLAKDRWSGKEDRRWGPSSLHFNVVGHGFLDGHVQMLSVDIDPALYLDLVTCAGREIVQDRLAQMEVKRRRRDLPTEDRYDVPEDRRPIVRGKPWGLIEWSPVAVGDLEVSFPGILSLSDFKRRSLDDPTLSLTLGKGSQVFDYIDYIPKSREFTFYILEERTRSDTERLFRQLQKSLGEPEAGGVGKSPVNATWKKYGKWGDRPGQAATFHFTLADNKQGASTTLVIRVELDK